MTYIYGIYTLYKIHSATQNLHKDWSFFQKYIHSRNIDESHVNYDKEHGTNSGKHAYYNIPSKHTLTHLSCTPTKSSPACRNMSPKIMDRPISMPTW